MGRIWWFYPPKKRNRDICLTRDKSAYYPSQMCPLLTAVCPPPHGGRGGHFIGPGITPLYLAILACSLYLAVPGLYPAVSGLYLAVPGYTGLYLLILRFTWPFLAILGCTWAVPVCTWLYWAVPGPTELYWVVPGHTGLYLALLSNTGLYLGCTGLYLAVACSPFCPACHPLSHTLRPPQPCTWGSSAWARASPPCSHFCPDCHPPMVTPRSLAWPVHNAARQHMGEAQSNSPSSSSLYLRIISMSRCVYCRYWLNQGRQLSSALVG